jgi:protein-S-isoprenylcysteine O-methyltransferase Ste14
MSTNTSTDRRQPAVDAKAVVRFALFVLLFPVVVFATAGTLNWLMGWAFVAVMVGGTLISRVFVLRIHPDLAEERGHYTEKEGVPTWDRVIMPLVATIGSLAELIVAGLDHRYGWSVVPLWLQWASLGVLVLSLAVSTWAMAANRFFSAVARIQTDRGHVVVDRGPYAVVRHPAYAMGLPVQPAMVLALGSLWGLIPAALTLVGLVVRTALEDRLLRNDLPGYADYAKRVRYRLIPGIW